MVQKAAKCLAAYFESILSYARSKQYVTKRVGEHITRSVGKYRLQFWELFFALPELGVVLDKLVQNILLALCDALYRYIHETETQQPAPQLQDSSMLRRWFSRITSRPDSLVDIKARVCKLSDAVRCLLLHFLTDLSQGVAYDDLFNTCISKPEHSIAKNILTPQTPQFKQALYGVCISPAAKIMLTNLLNGEIDHPLFDTGFYSKSQEIEQKLKRIHDLFGSGAKSPAPYLAANIVQVSTNSQGFIVDKDLVAPAEVSLNDVLAVGGPETNLLSLWLDLEEHENYYTAAHGQLVGFLLHKNLVQRSFDEIRGNEQGELKAALFKWIANLLRCPLSAVMKERVIQQLQYDIFCSMQVENPRDRLIMHCLSRNCPLNSIRARIDGIVLLDEREAEWLVRLGGEDGGMYGVHLVSSFDASADLTAWAPNMVAVFDLRAQYEAGNINDAVIYRRILHAFHAKGACFVHIRGLLTINDTLLKWCGEYTKSSPWCYIILEDTNLTWNWPENCDRVSVQSTEGALGARGHRNLKFYHVSYLKQESKHPLYADINTVQSRYIKDWMHNIESMLAGAHHLSLVGPPGIGKTESIKKAIKRWETPVRATIYVDGSNDVFVRHAIADVLNRKLAKHANVEQCLLCCDEWHMMSRDQKIQVLLWAQYTRVRLVLIANRSDSEDVDLFDEFFREEACTMVFCRGTVAWFFEVFSSFFADDSYRTRCERRFFTLWMRCTRNLFGEEMMTLRLRKELSADVQRYFEDSIPIESLVQKLRKKVPTLPLPFCDQFVRRLMEYYQTEKDALFDMTKSYEDVVRLKEQEYKLKITTMNIRELSLVDVLVAVGILDTNEGCVSYPEFSSSSNIISRFYVYHPLQRLASWVYYMCALVGHHLDEESINALLFLFCSYSVNDLPMRFPQFIDQSSGSPPQSLSDCNVMYARVDCSDLDAVRTTIERGYAINRHELRARWAQESVTDYKRFERLASVWPEALNEITPDNLRSLLKVADRTLALLTVRQMEPKKDEIVGNSTYFIAAWKLYCMQPVRDKSFVRQDPVLFELPEDGAIIDLLDLLLWASLYAYNMLDVVAPPDEFECALQKELIAVTSHIYSEQDSSELDKIAKLVKVYSHLFAPLLCVGARGFSYALATRIATTQYPPHPDWPSNVQTLSSLWHGDCTAAAIDALYNDTFWFDFCQNNSFPPPRLIENLIMCKGGISMQWQTRILSTSGLMIPEACATPTVVQKFEGAVKYLYSHSRGFAIGNCTFLNLLLIMRERLFPTHNPFLPPKISTPQIVPSNPLHSVFVLDYSGSMQSMDLSRDRNRFQCVQEALFHYVEDRLQKNENDRVSVILFNHLAVTRFAWLPVTQLENMKQQLRSEGASGGTCFNQGILAAENILNEHRNIKYNPVLVFLSDGEDGGDNPCGALLRIKETEQVQGNPIYILTVLLSSDTRNTQRLRDMAQIGGDTMGAFRNTLTAAELDAAFAGISDSVKRSATT